MKIFEVENLKKYQTLRITLHNPPYENENILWKTGWKESDVTIREIKQNKESK